MLNENTQNISQKCVHARMRCFSYNKNKFTNIIKPNLETLFQVTWHTKKSSQMHENERVQYGDFFRNSDVI